MSRLGRALRLVWSVAPRLTSAGIALTVLQGLLPAGAVWLMKLIVDAVDDAIRGSDPEAAFSHIALLIGLAAALGLASVLVRAAQTVVDEALSQVVTDHVTDLIHSQSVAVDLEYYDNPHYHDVLFRAQQEAPYRPASIVKNLTTTGQALVSLVAMAGILITLHWAVGLIVVVASVPAGMVRYYYSNRLFAWQRRRTESERKSQYAHWLLTHSGYAKELRVFGLGERFRTWYRELRQHLRRESLELAARRSIAEAAVGTGAVLAVFGTFAFMAWRTIQGVIRIGDMVAYYQAFQTSLNSLQSVMRGLAALYDDSLFLTYYDEFMTLEPRVVSPARPKPVPRLSGEGIRFEAVDFKYPDTERTALSQVSLSIKPGEITALVGPNGSGKTTLVKLLCRLYDPSSGTVTMDGIDLRSFDLVELRRSMSVLFQDFVQYQLSARDNIHVGDVRLSETDPAIEKAADDAGVHDLIADLRHGYDTLLGKWFEEGEELSGGEWQKLALARAFVRNAQVLVLDEPTSALDPRAEWEVFRHVKELACGRAVVLVSHRFSTVSHADNIHIFDQGRIIESGTHEELLKAGGRYAQMYRAQAKAYRS